MACSGSSVPRSAAPARIMSNPRTGGTNIRIATDPPPRTRGAAAPPPCRLVRGRAANLARRDCPDSPAYPDRSVVDRPRIAASGGHAPPPSSGGHYSITGPFLSARRETRMSRTDFGRPLCAGLLWAALTLTSPTTARADSPYPIGINLAGVADWSTENIFVDAFKASRPWTPQKEGAAYGEGGKLEGVEKTGWPTRLADKQFAESLMFVDMPGKIPGGKYFVTWEGNGEIEFSEAARATLNRPGEIDVNPNLQFLALRVRKTDPKNPVKNIKVLKAEQRKAASPFLPTFLKRYEGFQVILFMDWQRTNNSKQEKWEQRTKDKDPTQATK